ncbi:hypothetical protein ABPG72_017761 [Tetrahymena utriculariae]
MKRLVNIIDEYFYPEESVEEEQNEEFINSDTDLDSDYDEENYTSNEIIPTSINQESDSDQIAVKNNNNNENMVDNNITIQQEQQLREDQ